MAKVIKAIFDGKVFHPQGTVKLPAHSAVEIVVRNPRAKAKAPAYSAAKLAARTKSAKNFPAKLDEYLLHTA